MSEYGQRDAPSDALERPPRSRHTRFLGVVFALTAALIATGLWLTPSASAYSGVQPWALIGVLAFLLVLVGACLLVAAALSVLAPERPGPQFAEAPLPFPDGSYPAGSFPYGTAPIATAPVGSAPVGPASVGPAATAPAPGDAEWTPGGGADAPAGRLLSMLGTLLGTVGVGLAAIAVALTVLLPTPTEAIMVQFTELVGRVQLEYCPTLPASFPGTASHDDLAGAATILPVKISAETCGNTDYTDGVWIYLNRAAITVSARP